MNGKPDCFALAVGLHNELEGKQYRKILVCRPNVKFDEHIGFLPGSETEKLTPFMRSVIDNLEILLDSDEYEQVLLPDRHARRRV